MAKLRHVALIVEDPEASAKFFEQAFDMKRAGSARRGIYGQALCSQLFFNPFALRGRQPSGLARPVRQIEYGNDPKNDCRSAFHHK